MIVPCPNEETEPRTYSRSSQILILWNVGDSAGFEKLHIQVVSMMYHSFKAIRSDDDITMFP